MRFQVISLGRVSQLEPANLEDDHDQQTLAQALADKAALLTINEAAVIARAHRRTITRWIALGRLPAAKTHAGRSGKVLIPKSALLALLAGVA